MKKLLTMQDLSCLGKCSLTVALPILSAMGVETAALPTAVLSTHTAFPSPLFRDMTEDIPAVMDHWKTIGAAFDGIYVGYLGSVSQVDQALELLERFPAEMRLVDPAMGDNGKLYHRVDTALVERIKALCAKADMIIPNLTEACALTSTPYRPDLSREEVQEILRKLTALGCSGAMVTGVSFSGDATGVLGLDAKANVYFYYVQEKLPVSCHGAGDAFAAVCAGARMRGKSWEEAAALAADFVARCIQYTARKDRDPRYGLCFEEALPELWRSLQ